MPLKTRLIPCLLLKNGLIIRSELFKYHQIIGDPISQLTRYNQWSVDELIYLDISTSDQYDVRRNDARIGTADKGSFSEIISEISRHCFVPLTVGGRIRSLDDMRKLFANGADKITINTLAIEQPEIVTRAANTFGSQAVVVSIDAKSDGGGQYRVLSGGRSSTDLDVVEWAREVERLGAGEILLNSIDRDGTAQGYDLELVRMVVAATQIPVIAIGGCGQWRDMVDLVRAANPAAIAAANIFHFTEMSYKEAKKYLAKNDVPVRLPLSAIAR
jgi:cyclase